MWFGVDGHDSLPVNVSSLRPFEELVHYHAVNAVLGSLCTLINSLLLAVFLSTPKFRNRYVVSLAGPYLDGQGKLLIQLCVADLINSVSIVMTGLNRIDLYSTAIETQLVPVRTSAECAAEAWLLFHLVGDLLIPVTIFWMGIERFTAIKYPIFYRTKVDGAPLKFVLVPMLSVIYVLIPIGWAFLFVNDEPTTFFCGRKAAFGESFGTFIYISNILCNVVATCLNAAAFILALRLASSASRMNRQVSVIRYYLIISVLSTLLVSLPNAIALSQLYIHRVKDSVSKPAYWMQTINSGIHFFVYLSLNRDFRTRTIEMFRPINRHKLRSEVDSPLRG